MSVRGNVINDEVLTAICYTPNGVDTIKSLQNTIDELKNLNNELTKRNEENSTHIENLIIEHNEQNKLYEKELNNYKLKNTRLINLI